MQYITILKSFRLQSLPVWIILLLGVVRSGFTQTMPDSLYPTEYLFEFRNEPVATIHVSTDGNDDTGDGSYAAPFRTVSMALSVADSGDVVALAGGHYDEPEGVRFRRPGITLMSRFGEWAVIQAPIDDKDNASIAVYMDTNAWYTTLYRLEIIGGYYYAVSTETRWDWGDTNDRTGTSHILIQDCIIHGSGRDCIKIKPNCNYITIRDCEIYNSGQIYPPGETDGNAEGIDNVNGDHMLVQDCYIHDTFSTGVYFKGGASMGVVERCRIENCGAAGVLVGFDTSPEYFDLVVNPEYYENIMGVVRNCLIINTRYAGIGLYAAKGARVVNNTIINAAQQAHAALYFGVTFQDWEPEAGRPASVDAKFINNLVVIPETSDALAVNIRYADELGGLSALEGMPVMQHNLYYHANGSARFEDNRPGFELKNGTLAQWQAHSGSDVRAMEADPLLDADYRPVDGSPAIDNGKKTVLAHYDLKQTQRTTPYDIGAFESIIATGAASAAKHPDTFNFSVHPNPAHSHFTVTWQNPTQNRVSLTLYNLLGQQVATLHRGRVSPGTQQAHFPTLNLPGGIYFLRCIVGNHSQNQKIMIVR